jgi:hypothetical protein
MPPLKRTTARLRVLGAFEGMSNGIDILLAFYDRIGRDKATRGSIFVAG